MDMVVTTMTPGGFARVSLLIVALVCVNAMPSLSQAKTLPNPSNLSKLDAPLLLVKRHSYQGIHIYYMYYAGGYVHHVLGLDSFKPQEYIRPDTAGEPLTTFLSTDDSHY